MNEEPLGPEEVVDILKREYDAADQHCGDIEQEQVAALRYYEGKPFGDEVDGRSQVVIPEVQETVDYMTASLLRPFVSGDKVVEFEAADEADEEGAEDATNAIHYVFMRRQDGYRVLHDWIQAALIEKYCAVKVITETEEKVSREKGLITEDMLGLLDDEPESIEPQEDGTLLVTIKRQNVRKVHKVIPLPSEEFRFSPRARHEDDCDYIAHVCRKTRSELVGMGFDKQQCYEVKKDHGVDDSAHAENRGDESLNWKYQESSAALEEVLLCEEYARIDVDGDGIAELVRCFRVEDEILRDAETGEPSIEVVEENPFVVFTPFPVAHRLVGTSLAEKVMDLQRISSVTARQLMDGMFNSNTPRYWIPEASIGENTLDDLLSAPVPGAPVRGGNGEKPTALTGGFDVGASLSVMEFWKGERETRTGITRMNQGLDADSMNKTATGAAMLIAKGEQQEEYIARNFAECVARMFGKMLRMMKAEAEPLKVKVDGQYRVSDPENWPDDMDVNIRVGLGTGSKARRIEARMAFTQLMAQGTELGEVTHEHRFNMADGLVRDMGLGKGDDFWSKPPEPQIDPQTGQPVPEPERPDPAEMEAQAQAMMKEREQAAREQEMQGKLMIEQFKAQQDAQRQEAKQSHEMAMAEERFGFEMRLAEQKAAWEAQYKRDLSNNDPGGRLDA